MLDEQEDLQELEEIDYEKYLEQRKISINQAQAWKHAARNAVILWGGKYNKVAASLSNLFQLKFYLI